jgi:sodium/hydrogen antiporter
MAAGVVLAAMARAVSLIARLPLSIAMVYLLVGCLLGPYGLSLVELHPLTNAELIERLSEVAVIISLFTAGLNLLAVWSDQRWWLAIRLAFASMALTVLMIALSGFFLLGLPSGAAFLLSSILAPTDPVLATDVQLEHPLDPSPLRFSLTGEVGLNDGATFPFVILGLLLGLPDGSTGWRWAWGSWNPPYHSQREASSAGLASVGLARSITWPTSNTDFHPSWLDSSRH